MASVAPGTVLAGKYRVTKLLGEGGMGVVVAATHVQLDELVALKFMLPHALGSVEAVGRFLREARAAVKLKSEHVARVSDVGTLDTGAPYIVMEYLEGTDLAGLLAARGPLPPDEAVDYVIQACDALAEAHSLGIVHRDLKPANLFLTHRRDGSPLVKVLDFGISKSSTLNEASGAAGESLTKTGAGLMGSPLYMSPEQMKSARTTDARTDVWALGVILYELLGGRAPFDADTLGGLMAQVLTETPPPLAALRPGLPAPLYPAIAKCLEKERENRWASVAELAIALAPVAPPRAHLLIDRIAGARGQGAATSGAEGGKDPHASRPSSPGGKTGPATTAPGWAETSAAPAPRARTAGAKVAVISASAMVLALAALGGAALRHTPAPASFPIAPAAAGAVVVAPPALPVDLAPASASASAAPPPLPAAAPVAKPPLSPPPAHRKAPAPLAPPPSPPSSPPAPVTHSSPPSKPTADIFDTSN